MPTPRRSPPGSLVRLMAPSGKMLGVAQFNPHSLIAARMLTRNKDAEIDRGFVAPAPRPRPAAARAAVRRAATTAWSMPRPTACRAGGRSVRRHARGPAQHRRHGGAGAAGRRGAGARWSARARSSPATTRRPRQLEGLDERGQGAQGRARPTGSSWSRTASTFVADPAGGQKTGWFYDQRDEPPVRRPARARPGRARRLQLLRRLRADRGRAAAPRR